MHKKSKSDITENTYQVIAPQNSQKAFEPKRSDGDTLINLRIHSLKGLNNLAEDFKIVDP